MEFPRPVMQIVEVEFACFCFEYTLDITPLALGDFAARAIPFKLGEDGVLRAGKVGAEFGFKAEGLSLGAGELGSLESTQARDEDIHFEHSIAMNDVEAGVASNGTRQSSPRQ